MVDWLAMNNTFCFYEPVVEYKKRTIENITLISPEDSYNHLVKFYNTLEDRFSKEIVVLVGMNTKNNVKFTKVISVGTERQCLVSVKSIIKECILFDCSSFVLAHNHPSLNPAPSSADTSITRKLREAANFMDITFQDHIVMGEKENDPAGLGYYSMRSAGYL